MELRRKLFSTFLILIGLTVLMCSYLVRIPSGALEKATANQKGHGRASVNISPGGEEYSHSHATIHPFPHHRSNNEEISQKNKLILFWTTSWSNVTAPIMGWDIRVDTLKDCPFQCDFTDRKDLLNISDALVYHGISWNHERRLPALPKYRGHLNQVWLFLRLESPVNYVENFTEFDGKFNWTSTYRLDSDVPFMYGKIEKITGQEKDSPIPTVESIRNKSLMAWMSSHCKTHSFREALVMKLRNFLPMDIYGRCRLTRLKCIESREECYRKFSTKYKFWLSLENSLCPDYLTEKTFYALQLGMVPILYAHPSVMRLLPKGSYINVLDFKTTEALANYIKFLDANSTEYLKYFEWRKHYKATPTDSVNDGYWCDLCTKLHREPKVQKSYPSIQNWFYKNNTARSECVDPSGGLRSGWRPTRKLRKIRIS